MITKIDWLSFSLQTPGALEGAGADVSQFVATMLRTYLGDTLADALIDAEFSVQPGRAPYSTRIMRADHFVNIFWGGQQRHILIEVSGGGCEDLGRKGLLLDFANLIAPRLTRMDIAVDMPVSTRPSEFVAAGYSKRIKASSHMITDTGETYYVGSRDSERYCRVYRYNPPHPRSEWLRCEFVLRHENAELAVAQIQDKGLLGVVAELGNAYGWRHAAWQPDIATDEIASAWRPERRHGATVRWLVSSVFPAMARLVEEGVIDDLPAFLDQNLYKLIPD